MKKIIETYIVDSFTNESFKGNPAGVCILAKDIDNNLMQSIANELGLSETAFIRRIDNDYSKYLIRFFSPKMEIPLCGHATLASSKVIFEKHSDLNEIKFVNINNLDLPIERNDAIIKMVFPIYETKKQDTPNELLAALGIDKIINSVYNTETQILLIEIDDSIILSKLSPNYEKLMTSHNSLNGVLVKARSQKVDFDFESRYFWPWSGTNEDPVTGGTHTFLTKYWSSRLNKKRMRSYQCSQRSGYTTVELINEQEMTIESEAQIVFKGEIKI